MTMPIPEAGGDPQPISVIIPAYNASATIAECLDSIVAAGSRPREIIVVDDASTDATVAIVQEIALRHPGIIQLVRLDRNSGPARARNRGAEAARGELLLFLDSDTRVLPDTMAAFVRRIPEADVVVGIYDYHPINEIASAWYQALIKHYLFASHGLTPYESFNGAIGGLRKHTFRKVGGFNDTLVGGMDYENEEFGRRLIKAHVILMDPAMQVRHVFPGFSRLVKLSFRRASQRTRLILERVADFESSGPVTREYGVASVAAVAALALLPLAWLLPFGWLPPLFFAAYYLKVCGGLLFFVGRNRPGFLPQFLLLHLFFCWVLTLAALHGWVQFLVRRPIRPTPVSVKSKD
jgi:glycosyltransferase involved in cell wall biosynthesis